MNIVPQEVSDALLAFPGSVGPLMKDCPSEFRHPYWSKWQRTWFFEGLKEYPAPKDGVDLRKAMRHLTAIQRSFEPKHEHKEAAVAFLASQWFDVPREGSIAAEGGQDAQAA
jgi:hypothetical protein